MRSSTRLPDPRLVRAAALASIVALAVVATANPAQASTVISISGGGDLQLTTTGNLHFATAGLDATRIDLFVDDRITTGLPAFAYPTMPDARLAYSGLSGSTVLSFDDDVFIVDFVFQGTIDFRSASMIVAGDLVSAGSITIGSGAISPPPTPCRDGSGAVVSSGAGAGVIVIGGCRPGGVIRPGPPISIAATPEPGAALLFCAGFVVVAARVRRTR